MSESADASLVSKASTRYPGCKPDTMKMSSIRFRTQRLVAEFEATHRPCRSRLRSAVKGVAEFLR